MVRLLLVEDDAFIRDVILYYLQKEQSYEVVCASTAGEALARARESFDAILLDILLPDANGIDLCAHLREWHDCPIIFVSCLDDSETIVRALSAGGDDFIVKPFDNKVMGARIEANLRRWHNTQLPQARAVLFSDELVLGSKKRTVLKNGIEIRLSETEYRLLELFMSNPRRGFTRARSSSACGAKTATGHRARCLCIFAICGSKIEDDPSEPRYVVTEWGKGYLFPFDTTTRPLEEAR